MRSFALSIVVLATGLVALPRLAAAQENPPAHPGAPPCPAGQECPMQPDHEAMMARHQAMMQAHEAGAARIQELQDRMHGATGEAKVEAMEALLDELLAQHRAMHESMMQMHHPGGMGSQGTAPPAPEPPAD